MLTHVERVHVPVTPLRRSEESSDIVSHDAAHKMAAAKWSNSVTSKEAEDVLSCIRTCSPEDFLILKLQFFWVSRGWAIPSLDLEDLVGDVLDKRETFIR